MCFRPATAEASISCPECEKKINAAMGLIPNICPFCGANLESLVSEINQGEGTLPSMPSPMSPGAPKFPMGGPGAPKFPMGGPGAPKFPMGGPGAPKFPMGGPGAPRAPSAPSK
jgi:hypothetical protein